MSTSACAINSIRVSTHSLLVNDIIDMLNNNIELNSTLITASGGAARDSLLQFISDLTVLFAGASCNQELNSNSL